MSATIRKVIQCLDALAECQAGASATEIADRMGVSLPTSGRLLRALSREGLARRDERTQLYHLGMKLFEWGAVAERRRLPVNVARKEIVAAVADLHRRIDLVVLEGCDSLLLERTEWLDGQAVTRPLPFRVRWDLTATGKAIVAFSASSAVDALLKRGRRHGEPALPARADLERQLGEVRARGYAEVRAAFAEDLFGIGVPIFDATDTAVAALGLTTREEDLAPGRVERFLTPLKAAAGRISEYLGSQHTVAVLLT